MLHSTVTPSSCEERADRAVRASHAICTLTVPAHRKKRNSIGACRAGHAIAAPGTLTCPQAPFASAVICA